MSNNEFSTVEPNRPGENTRPENANQRPESLDPLNLLREGQTGEQRPNLRESTGQAVEQGLLPQVDISDEGQRAPGPAPLVEPPASAEAHPEQPATAREAPPAEPQAQQPEARQPRRGTIQAGAVAAARANTAGADAEIASVDSLPDAPPTATGEVVNGFVSHIVDHPVETGLHLASGAGATVIAALVTPSLATAAAIGGGAYLAYRGVETVRNVLQAAPVYNNPAAHTREQHAQARTQLRHAGESAAGLVVSGAGGGLAGVGGHALAGRAGSGFVGRIAARMRGEHGGEGAVIIREAERHAAAQPFERAPGTISNLPIQQVGNEGGEQRGRSGSARH